jgi:hypothetical protein
MTCSNQKPARGTEIEGFLGSESCEFGYQSTNSPCDLPNANYATRILRLTISDMSVGAALTNPWLIPRHTLPVEKPADVGEAPPQ